MVSPGSLSGDRTDVQNEFVVCLYGDSFCIDWSHGKSLSAVVRFQQASFHLAESELCRITFSGLGQSQLNLLGEHLERVQV